MKPQWVVRGRFHRRRSCSWTQSMLTGGHVFVSQSTGYRRTWFKVGDSKTALGGLSMGYPSISKYVFAGKYLMIILPGCTGWTVGKTNLCTAERAEVGLFPRLSDIKCMILFWVCGYLIVLTCSNPCFSTLNGRNEHSSSSCFDVNWGVWEVLTQISFVPWRVQLCDELTRLKEQNTHIFIPTATLQEI